VRNTKVYYVGGSNAWSHITKFKKQCFGIEICSYNYALHLYTCVALLVLPALRVRHALISLMSFYTII